MGTTHFNLNFMEATSRALWRRSSDTRFVNQYFTGRALDVGGATDGLALVARFFPRLTEVITFDQEDGDAQTLPNVASNSYDTVYSSHCLEHVRDPVAALDRWIDVTKPGGHLVIAVPDEDMYEQGIFPSTFNDDHKHTFAMAKDKSWSPVSINVLDLVAKFRSKVDVLGIELLDHLFRDDLPRFDKSRIGYCECAIEFVLKKKK